MDAVCMLEKGSIFVYGYKGTGRTSLLKQIVTEKLKREQKRKQVIQDNLSKFLRNHESDLVSSYCPLPLSCTVYTHFLDEWGHLPATYRSIHKIFMNKNPVTNITLKQNSLVIIDGADYYTGWFEKIKLLSIQANKKGLIAVTLDGSNSDIYHCCFFSCIDIYTGHQRAPRFVTRNC